MGSTGSLMKAIFFPALISLTIYLFLFYVIIPSIRRYRERYSQYVPLHAISQHTSTLRERVYDTVMRFVLRVTSRRRAVDGPEGSDSWFDEDGEEMEGFEQTTARHPGLNSHAPQYIDPGGRLSRELEQGFMDDSDDEGRDPRRVHGRGN